IDFYRHHYSSDDCLAVGYTSFSSRVYVEEERDHLIFYAIHYERRVTSDSSCECHLRLKTIKFFLPTILVATSTPMMMMMMMTTTTTTWRENIVHAEIWPTTLVHLSTPRRTTTWNSLFLDLNETTMPVNYGNWYVPRKYGCYIASS